MRSYTFWEIGRRPANPHPEPRVIVIAYNRREFERWRFRAKVPRDYVVPVTSYGDARAEAVKLKGYADVSVVSLPGASALAVEERQRIEHELKSRGLWRQCTVLPGSPGVGR